MTQPLGFQDLKTTLYLVSTKINCFDKYAA